VRSRRQATLSNGCGCMSDERCGSPRGSCQPVHSWERKRDSEMFGGKGTTIGCWLVWCCIFLTYHISEAPAAGVNGMTRSLFQNEWIVYIATKIDTVGERSEREREREIIHDEPILSNNNRNKFKGLRVGTLI